ncbi:MAG TPA: hypothetical protein PKG95_14555 [Anaerolineaceae bacterium]|jgi:hypothetical protein|nr:hypothetical protein [Anaerolineaceae bacterium]
MITKLRQSPKLFALLVLIPSVVFPIAGFFLSSYSCPHLSGLARFPVISAECFGEYLGEIGLCCFGFPGMAVAASFVLLIQAILVRLMPPGMDLLMIAILGLLLNYLIYYLVLRLLFPKIPAVSNPPGLSETSMGQDAGTNQAS